MRDRGNKVIFNSFFLPDIFRHDIHRATQLTDLPNSGFIRHNICLPICNFSCDPGQLLNRLCDGSAKPKGKDQTDNNRADGKIDGKRKFLTN